MDIAAATDAEDSQYVYIPRHYHAHMTLADRRFRGTEDKAAGQCQGDLGVQVDSLTTLFDFAVANATARSYYLPLLPQKRHRSREHTAPLLLPRRRGRQRRAPRSAGHSTPWR